MVTHIAFRYLPESNQNILEQNTDISVKNNNDPTAMDLAFKLDKESRFDPELYKRLFRIFISDRNILCALENLAIL